MKRLSLHSGLPIGNLTSQFGANVYLNELDHFIARTLKPRAYIRYMDDLLLLDTSPDPLKLLTEPINDWLCSHRAQILNSSKTRLLNLRREEMAYLGYRMRQTDSPAQPLVILAEPKKKWDLVRSLKYLERDTQAPRFKPHLLGRQLPRKDLLIVLASINSRIGTLLHAKSFRFRMEVLKRTFRIRKQLYRFLGIKKGYRALRFKRRRRKRDR